jgi:peptidoglycan/xylan/chitin deacetylase (PgdA/CDA1 family)
MTLAGPPPPVLRGRVPTLLPTRRRVVALTFDAGGDDGGLPRIYRTLIRLHAQATFFMTGHFASYYPGWARRVAARFPICNHTFDHVDLLPLADAEVRSEVVSASRTIRRITGSPPQPIFRFPYGTYDARTLRIVNSLGYAAVGWTFDTAGWLGVVGGQSVASVVRRVRVDLRPGAIILMHVGATPADKSILDADALATVIAQIRKRGYHIVALPAAYAALYPAWARG